MRDDKGGEKEKPRFFEGLTYIYIHMVGVGELKVHAAASRMVSSIYGKGGEKGEGKSQCCNSVPLLFGLTHIYMPAANNIGLLYM